MKPIRKKAVKLSKHHFHRLALQAFERDGFQCQIESCGRVFLYHDYSGLAAHHIYPRGRLRLDVLDNLLSICWFDCHHNATNGIGEPTVDQLIEQYWHRIKKYLE